MESERVVYLLRDRGELAVVCDVFDAFEARLASSSAVRSSDGHLARTIKLTSADDDRRRRRRLH